MGERTMVVRTRHPSFILASVAVFVGLSFTGPVFAFEDQDSAQGLPDWQAVSSAELDASRAKGIDQEITMTDNDNSHGDITINGNGNGTVNIYRHGGGGGGAGTNTISSDSFAGMHGLSNVILNNGNGAAIQAGISVDLTFNP